MRNLYRGLTVCLLMLSATALAQQDLWVHVNGNDSGNDCTFVGTPCQTVNHAIGQSSNGDTINMGSGEFTETVSTGNRVLTFRGQSAGPGGTILQAHEDGWEQATNRVLTVGTGANITVENLWIRHGNSDNSGGGIFVIDSELTMIDSRVSDNRAIDSPGGGFFLISGSTLTLENTVVRDNQADNRGGGIDLVGSSVVTVSKGSEIVDNQSGDIGGGIFAGGGTTLTISESVISGNESGDNGGGISAGNPSGNAPSEFQIVDSVISSNTSGSDGGGIWSRGDLEIQRTEIADNVAEGLGGGITMAFSSQARINRSTI